MWSLGLKHNTKKADSSSKAELTSTENGVNHQDADVKLQYNTQGYNVNYENYTAAEEFINHFLQRLLDDLKKEPQESQLFRYGKLIGLNNGNVELHKNRIAAEFDKIGYIYRQLQEIKKSIHTRGLAYYQNLNIEILIAADQEKYNNLKKSFDLSDSSSFASKTRKEITNCKQALNTFEKQEWVDAKNQLFARVQQAWNDYDQYANQLQQRQQKNFLSKIDQLEQSEEYTRSYIIALQDAVKKTESSILQEIDVEKLRSIKEKKDLLDSLIVAQYKKNISILLAIQEEVEALDNFFINELGKCKKITESRTQDIKQALRSLPENPNPKTRFYLWIIFCGFLLSATAEVAIMNKFAGEVLAIGTIPDKLDEISNFVSMQENSSGFELGTRKTTWTLVRYITDLLFLVSFSAIPFVLSFVAKVGFEIKTSENPVKCYFFYLAAPIGILYIGFLAYATVQQNTDQRIATWQFGALLFLISLSMVLLSGWLLHLFVKGYESFKQTTGNRLLGGKKSYQEIIRKKIFEIQGNLDSKQREMDNIQQRIANAKETIHKQEAGFRSMKDDMPPIEIDTIKTAAIQTIQAGYDLGVKVRGKGEVDEKYLDSRSIEELVQLEQKLTKFDSIFN